MKVKYFKCRDFYAGLLLIFFGLTTILIARSYPMGTMGRMGPGYFPTMLGGILTLLGLIIAGRALWSGGPAMRPWALRPLALVLGAVLAFAVLVNFLGLVVAVLSLIVISCLGGWEFHPREVAILCLVLVLLTVTIFVYGIGMTFKLWPV